MLQPHLTTAGGWYSDAIFIGLDPSSAAGRLNSELRFWNVLSTEATGHYIQIAAGQMLRIPMSDVIRSTPEGFSGSMSYQIAAPPKSKQAGLLAFVEVGIDAIAGSPPQYFRAVIPPIPLAGEAVLEHVAFGPDSEARIWGTGVIVRDGRIPLRQNSTRKNRVNFRLFSASGERLQTRDLDLVPGEKRALSLPLLFPEMRIPQFGGYVRIQSNMPIQFLASYWLTRNDKTIAAAMIPQIPTSGALRPAYTSLAAGALLPPPQPNPIPEPSTLVLLSIGILSLAVYSRQRRKLGR